jgi:hypothetical protein
MARSNKDNQVQRQDGAISVLQTSGQANAIGPDEARQLLGEVGKFINRKPSIRVPQQLTGTPTQSPITNEAVTSILPFFSDGEQSSELREIATLLDVLRTQVPLVQPPPLRVHLDELHTWHNEAMVQLLDLIARRRGIGIVSHPLPGEMSAEIDKATRSLIGTMSKNALDISKLEATDGRWLAAAEAAHTAIRLRRNVGAEVLAEPLNPNPQAHLSLAYATFMVEGNSPRLRRELEQAAQAMPESASIAYRQARYAIMAGDYQTAYEAMMRAPTSKRIVEEIQPILQPKSAAIDPWKSYPCNFYTYRYTLIDNDQINATKLALSDAGEAELSQKLSKKLADAATYAALKTNDHTANAGAFSMCLKFTSHTISHTPQKLLY